MSVISYKKRSLCIPKKYNNFNSIEIKSAIKIKDGYINNQFYKWILYYSKFNNLYDVTLYNCVNQNHMFSLNNGYIKINKSISFQNSFYICMELKLTDYTINQVLMMNEDNEKGFRLSINKFGYKNKLLFQLYTQNDKKEVSYELKQLLPNFNKVEIVLKNKILQLYFNDDFIQQTNNVTNIRNSDKPIIIGSYYSDQKYFNTLSGELKNIIISENNKLF